MGADANIFQQYLRAPKSVQEYNDEANVSQLHQQNLQKNALELQASQQSMQRSNALRDLVTNMPTDPAQRVKALRAANTPEAWAAAEALEKSQSEIGNKQSQTDKYTAEAEAKRLEKSIKSHDFALQQLQTANDPVDAHAWAAEQFRNGAFTREQYAQGVANIPNDPAKFAAWKEQAMRGGVSVLDNLKIQHEDLRNAATNATSRANNQSTVSATIRGQNLVDARARETHGATVSKPFEVTGPDGKPVLVRQDKAGNITPVEGYGAKPGKAPTEFQGKSAGFGARAEEADKIISDLESSGQYSRSGALAGGGNGIANTLLNPVLSKDTQKAIQAQRDFVNAVLRQESGAAISQGEFDNARRQYFPQPGDKPEVIAQKANNRKLAIQGFKNNAGVAAFSAPGDSKPQPGSGVTVSNW